MEWFHGQLKELWGVPIFWVARTAKTAQFLSAMVILLEIIGKERVEESASVVRQRLSRMVEARPLGDLKESLYGPAKYYLLAYLTGLLFFSKKYREKSNKYLDEVITGRVEWTVWRVFIMFSTLLLIGWQFDWGWPLIWKVPLILFLVSSSPFIFFILGNTIMFLFFTSLRPIAWMLDRFAALVVYMLGRIEASRLWLIISLCFLVMGFLLELLAS